MNLRSWQENFLQRANERHEDSALMIYADSMLGARIASLRVTYEAVVNLIGQTAFDCIATSYFSYFTQSPVDIGLIGVAFPEYLNQHDIMSHLPYIADLARFEWQRHTVFESNSQSGDLNMQQYVYPVDCIWACCQKDYKGDFDIDLTPQNITIVMYRVGLNIVVSRQFADT